MRREPLPGITGLPGWLRRNLSRRARRVLLAATLIGLTGLAVAVPLVLHHAGKRSAREARADRELRAARRRETIVLQRPHEKVARGDRGHPAALTRATQGAILADARVRHDRRELPDRPIGARCARFVGVRSPRGILLLDCLALTSEATGYPFRARVVVASGRLTWCRNIYELPGDDPIPLSPRCSG